MWTSISLHIGHESSQSPCHSEASLLSQYFKGMWCNQTYTHGGTFVYVNDSIDGYINIYVATRWVYVNYTPMICFY